MATTTETEVSTSTGTKAVEWYQPGIRSLSPGIAEFFKLYVGLEDENAIKAHIYRVRDEAWKV